MVQVVLSDSLKAATDGKTKFEIDAANIHQLFTRLGEDYPKLKPILERGVAVAINGQIYRDEWFQPIAPGSEVYILPRMAGG